MYTECGIFSLYSIHKAPLLGKCITGLTAIQHRGQESCGISFNDGKKIMSIRGFGLVHRVFKDCESPYFDKDILNKAIIGHVRYSTSGVKKKDMDCVQPITTTFKEKSLAFCFNGNIPLFEKQYPNCKTDSLAFKEYLTNFNSIEVALKTFIRDIPGVYCLVVLYRNELYVVRDRYGVRPLSIGYIREKISSTDAQDIDAQDIDAPADAPPDAPPMITTKPKILSYSISSETIAFDKTDYDLLRHVNAGEIIKINQAGLQTIYRMTETTTKCLFEFIYFLNPESIFDNIEAAQFRNTCGMTLANSDKECIFSKHDTVVVGCPNSGIESGRGYAKASGLYYYQVIMKNPNINRTFILSTQEDRIKHIKKKYVFVDTVIKDKIIVLVDDSVVRGNTLKILLEQLWEREPKEIHVRVASPPVVNSCYFGIDIPTSEELVYNSFPSNELMTIQYNVNSFKYMELSDIEFMIGCKVCSSCFTGKYNKDIFEW
jgi:amidophosphoribosyltransferase